MDIYTRRDLPRALPDIRARLAQGQVAILPTDTIYGLSANALNESAVEAILRIKRRRKPVSVVLHSLEWGRLVVDPSHQEEFEGVLEQYRGPYTTFWKYQGRHARLPRPVCSSGLVGFRQPRHWITELAEALGFPLVSTSANLTRQAPMTSLEDVPEALRAEVDFLVYEGPLPGPPSTLVHCYQKPFRFEER